MADTTLFPWRLVPDALPDVAEHVCALWEESEQAIAEGPSYALGFTDKARLFRLFENYFLWATQALVVEDKMTQQMVPFRFKPVQRELAMIILHDWYAGIPVRLIVLKARREGVSTTVQSFFAWRVTLFSDRKGLTMAQDDETALTIHQMQERFYENLPEMVQPMRGVSQAGRVLELSNPTKNRVEKRRNPGLRSWVRTVSLGNAGAGKGATMLHLSEVALWAAEKAVRAITTVLQIVPRAPETIVVQESTARGIGNLFHQRWNRAVSGVSAYRPIFIGWQEEPTNRVPPPPGFERTQEEDLLAHEYGLDDAQLYWRRRTIEDDCGGDIDEFHQEYPLTPDEAFLSSGRPYFDPRVVRRHAARAERVPPVQTGHLREVPEVDGKKGPWTIFTPSPRMFTLRIWETPDPQNLEDYLISADAAGGSPELAEINVSGERHTRKARGDWHAAYVWKRSEMKIVASWHGKTDRDEYGDHLYRLGKLYAGVSRLHGDARAGALIACEITGGWGMVPLIVLKRRGYHRLYHRHSSENQWSRDVLELLGWETTVKTRPLILDALHQAMRKDVFDCPDPELYKEIATFVYNENGKPEAMPGCFDDRVMAAAVGAYLWQTEGRAHPPLPQEQHALSAVTAY